MTLFIEITIWFFYFIVGMCVFSFIVPRVSGYFIQGFYNNKYNSGYMGGIFSLICLYRFSFTWKFYIIFILFLILSTVTVVDYFTLKIPDSLVFVILICSVLSVLIFQEISLDSRFIGFFAVSVPLFIISVLTKGSFGGGDIKFMAACGFFLGWEAVVYAVFIASITGGIYGICALICRKVSRKDSIAFGPFLCMGIGWVLLSL